MQFDTLKVVLGLELSTNEFNWVLLACSSIYSKLSTVPDRITVI